MDVAIGRGRDIARPADRGNLTRGRGRCVAERGGMRLAWICVLLAGCSLYLEDHHKKHVPPDAVVYIPDTGLLTCPYSAPEPTVPCYTPGQVCAYIDAEYDCTCRCDASGYWSCAPEVIGAHCPTLPPPDAGPLYPDAPPYPDGAP
jgi:hypothetical protein